MPSLGQYQIYHKHCLGRIKKLTAELTAAKKRKAELEALIKKGKAAAKKAAGKKKSAAKRGKKAATKKKAAKRTAKKATKRK